MKWLSGDQLNLLSGGFVVLVVLLVIGGFSYVWLNTRAATAAADQWFALLQQGQFEKAYALNSMAFRQSTSLLELRQQAELSGLTHRAQITWSHREVEKKIATLAGGILTPDKSTLQVAVQLNKNGDSWFIDGVEVGPLIGRKMRRFIDIRVSTGLQIKVTPLTSERQ